MEFAIPGQPHFRVHHDSSDDGGGTWFGQEYIEILQQRYQKKWNRCLEWCSGPGFIGFGILSHGLCNHLVLQDYHAPLATHIALTAQANNCVPNVEFHCGTSISCMPAQQFDLVVANPPHYLECPGDENYQRLAVDPGWKSHIDFFHHIPKYLHPDGTILLQENQAGSLRGVHEFWDMIHSNHLKITSYWSSSRFWDTNGPNQIYYIEIQHRK